VERGRTISAEQLREDLAGRAALASELDATLQRRGCDLWISPAARGAAPLGLQATGDPIMNLPWTHAGVPTVALPAGRGASRMPVGVQLAAPSGADLALLAMAEGLEQALRASTREAAR
jgi:Asp-tRNA(Asn)/Glu-tRNA(Gln) amidotransferase A subunit family amidase